MRFLDEGLITDPASIIDSDRRAGSPSSRASARRRPTCSKRRRDRTSSSRRRTTTWPSAESLAEDVANAAREAGIEPSQLDLEITEQMLSTGRSGLAALHQLRGQGVRVLIDDFGTGYVSLGKLRSSPLDGIMIDRSFVEEVGHDHEARAVCRAAIALGHRLRPAHRRRGHRDRGPGTVPDRRTVPRGSGPSVLCGHAAREPVGQNPAGAARTRQLLFNALPSARIVDIAHGFNRPLSEVRHTFPESRVTHARCRNCRLPPLMAPFAKADWGHTRGDE